MEINWTTVVATAVASAITATVVGIVQFVVMRYFTKAWERLESHITKKEKSE